MAEDKMEQEIAELRRQIADLRTQVSYLTYRPVPRHGHQHSAGNDPIDMVTLRRFAVNPTKAPDGALWLDTASGGPKLAVNDSGSIRKSAQLI